jgi:hypothetical protein
MDVAGAEALPVWTDIFSSAIAPALLYYTPFMALCNICIPKEKPTNSATF